MIGDGSFEFAQARIQARLSLRPGPAIWARLDAVREAGSFLELARRGLPGVASLGITGDTSIHGIDQRVSEAWRASVDELASWLPAAWRRAVHWCALLPRLPAAIHLARGRERHGWMGEDPLLRPLLSTVHPAAATALAASRFGRFVPTIDDPRAVHAYWYRLWRRRLPPMAYEDAAAVATVERIFGGHFRRFRETPVGDAWGVRRQLERALSSCAHRHPLTPAPAFAYLGLRGLDLERFRGELARRILFRRGHR